MVPWSVDGVSGILLAVSTPESIRAYKASIAQNQRGGMITEPDWLYYGVYWFAGLCMFNFAGLSDPQYEGRELPGNLGMLLEQECSAEGIDFSEYVNITRGTYYESFRYLLRDVGVFKHLQITTCMSCNAFRGLEAYLTVFEGIAPPAQEAHFRLNTEYAPADRQLLYPSDWYRCKVWHSVGQRDLSQYELRDNCRVKGIIMRIRALLSSILQILNRRALRRALKYLLFFFVA